MIAWRCYREIANVILIRSPLKMAMVVLRQLLEVNILDCLEDSRASSFDGFEEEGTMPCRLSMAKITLHRTRACSRSFERLKNVYIAEDISSVRILVCLTTA